MANLSLFTRPQCFNEIIGQKMAVEQTINHLNSLLEKPDDLVQAVILSGPRGTGKTSTARLIGQYLNCLEIKKDISIPCQCKNCTSIQNNPTTAYDYHELDAASQSGVADIEKIVEQSFYAPLDSFKIIVLDEVHMLSRQAFNVLLKQLEEPPKKVLYILATTEEHKILETVRSRCKIRRFNLLSDDEISQHIFHIVNNPNLIPNTQGLETEDILNHIVSMAKGSMRDAIKTLDEILDLDDKSLLNVQRATGSGDIKKLGTLLYHLFDKNLAQMLLDLHALEKNGTDPKKLMQQLQLMLTDILNVKAEAEITRLLSVAYYKEKFGVSINTTSVCDMLGSLIATEGIARNNVTYHVLTYALVECYRKLIVADTPTIATTDPSFAFTVNTPKDIPIPATPINQTAFTHKDEIIYPPSNFTHDKATYPPSNYNPDRQDNTASKLSQILQSKKESVVTKIEKEEEKEEDLW